MANPAKRGKPVIFEAPDAAAPAKPESRRLTVLLDADGKVAFDRLHTSTRDSLKTALADGSLLKSLGLQADTAASSAGAFSGLPPIVGMALVQSVQTIETAIILRATKAPRQLVLEYATFTPQEAGMLGQAINAVLNKYSAAFFQKYGEEAALVGLLSALTMAKISAVREAMAKQPGPRVVNISDTQPGPESVQ